MALVDRNQRYLKINLHFAELNGQPIEKHIGRTLQEMIPRTVEDAPESAESAEITASFSPAEQASTDPEPAVPVVDEPSHGSSGSSQGSSSSFPETAELEPDINFEEPSGPLAEVRAALEEKLATMKEEAKARVEAAILEKAEAVKERIKEKIRHKIEDAISHHKDNAENPGKSFRSKVEKRLKTAAKDAVKKLVKEHHGKAKAVACWTSSPSSADASCCPKVLNMTARQEPAISATGP